MDKNLKYKYIKLIFDGEAEDLLKYGMWLSGVDGEGTWVEWYYNPNGDSSIYKRIEFKNHKMEGEYASYFRKGRLIDHTYYTKNKEDGEFKNFQVDGSIRNHLWYKKGNIVKNFITDPGAKKDYNLKPGYILGSNGKYYKDI